MPINNVELAANTGVAGLSIEDATGDAANPLFEFALAVARVRAARAALDRVAPLAEVNGLFKDR